MTSEAAGPAVEARWWQLPRFQRGLWHGLAGLFVAVSLITLGASLSAFLAHEAHAWRMLLNAVGYRSSTFLLGRRFQITSQPAV